VTGFAGPAFLLAQSKGEAAGVNNFYTNVYKKYIYFLSFAVIITLIKDQLNSFPQDDLDH